MEEKRISFRGSVGKPVGNGQLGKRKYWYECHVKCVLKTCYLMVLTGYVSEKEGVACCCKHVDEKRVPYYEGKVVTAWATISFARGTLLHSVIPSFCVQFSFVPYVRVVSFLFSFISLLLYLMKLFISVSFNPLAVSLS